MAASGIILIRKTGSYVLLLLLAATGVSAQDPGRTVSPKVKDAGDKGAEATAVAGKSLAEAKDSAAPKPTSRFRRQETKAEEKIEPVDLNTPIKAAQPKIVPRTVKEDGRDPFRPATLQKKVVARPRENLSPLERFELNQLKIVGIVWDMKEPRAMVEDSTGLGYTIKVGAPIGANDGVVKAIYRN